MALVCGFALIGEAPARAGTVLRGKVSVPAALSAKAGQVPFVGDKVSATDVVVYVTEKPGWPKLAGRGKKADVTVEDEGFDPWVLAVTARSKVKFRNDSHVYHSLFSVSSAGRSDLGSLAPGERRETRFDQPGVYNLFCQLHPAASGFVMVCPNWFHARPTASGDYVLPSLPRGAYIVHAWHPRLGEVKRTIVTTGRDVVRMDLGF